MAEPTHERLRRILHRALELDGASREAFLEGACRGDEVLLRRVRELLTSVDNAATASATVDDVAAGTAPVQEGPGSHIGPYKLLQKIGEGGFGIVFLAEQEQPVRRRVALKVIKLGMDTRQVVARFEQERQALALMDHPNIARVFDAGATQAGRPYFVMELVRGEPIVEYCDQHKLTVDERLELFEQVCDAVQHAHQRGVIHRDIKPSNILVATQDDRPRAKVIDFGIAKATLSKLTDKTLYTEFRQVIGTLQYMSPEQAQGSLDIDTRTDVYSLGVVLYELLAGSTPFEEKTLNAALFSEMQRLIREVDPPRPSTRLRESADTLARIAERRRVEPARLGTLLRGELDWIVMKALEKERARRYDSPNSLALDVRRYLSGEAVLAAPPSSSYRLRKFVRRNKGAVAAAIAVAASLFVGALGFAWQARVARAERDAAVEARQAEAREHQKAEELARAEAEQRGIAESNEKKAGAINQFLLDMLGAADVRDLGRDARVSQVLDRAALTVGSAFTDRPEVESAVRRILGRTYTSLGLLDQAEPQIARTEELVRDTQGERSVDYVRVLSDLASVARARGKREESEKYLRQALDTARELTGPNSTHSLSVQSDYANALVALGRNEEAENLFREALAVYRGMGDQNPRELHVLLNSLAVLMHNEGRLDEAESLYREALEIGERSLGAHHPDTLTARMNMASALSSRGKFEEAEQLFLSTYAEIKTTFGEAHRRTAEVAGVLGNFMSDRGRFKDARPYREEALEILRRIEGDGTESVAAAKQALALTLQRLGDNERCVELEREALAAYVALGGADSPKALQAELDLANALSATGKLSDAEPLFAELLERCPRVLGEDHETTIIAFNSFAVLMLRQERYAEAEPYLRKALESGRRAQGADHGNTLITQHNLASALRELGKLDEAESIGRDTLERFIKVFGARHANVSTAHTSLGETLTRLGKTDEARREFEEAIAIAKEAYGAKNPAFTNTARLLARLLTGGGHPSDAEPILREALEVQANTRGPADKRTTDTQLELARCLRALQRFDDAEAELRAVDDVLSGLADVAAARRRACWDALAELHEAWEPVAPGHGHAASAAEWRAKSAALPAEPAAAK